jgi:hypothetical protein
MLNSIRTRIVSGLGGIRDRIDSVLLPKLSGIKTRLYRDSNSIISRFDVVSDDIGPKSSFLPTIVKNHPSFNDFLCD